MNDLREAGLPRLYTDANSGLHREAFSKGVVRRVYPDLWRVDIESEVGGLIHKALVIGPHLPPIDQGAEQPSHVVFTQIQGHVDDVICWPLTFRRFFGPETPNEEEHHYYQVHLHCERAGNITVRVTDDGRWVIESEEGDYIALKTDTREIRVIAPAVYLGRVEDGPRIEYQDDDVVKVIIPRLQVGNEENQLTAGIDYRAGEALYLRAPLIKLTAERIVLDPVAIQLGSEDAEERAILGDLFQQFWAQAKALFDAHVHSGVQVGGGTSNVPTTTWPAMSNDLLSETVRLQDNQ
jgi:hypothetical protein